MAEYTIDKIEYGGNIYKFQDNVSGYITTDNDTKNTAGSTDTSSKIFLIGATSQAANPQTYSHDTAYVGTDGCLYSGGVKVLTAHQTAVTSLTTTAGAHTTISNKTGATSIAIPTKTSHLTNDSGYITSYTDEKVKWTVASVPSSGTTVYYPLVNTSTATTSTLNTIAGFNLEYSAGGTSRTLVLGHSTNEGIIKLYQGTSSTKYVMLKPSSDVSTDRTIQLPNASGTIALTSNITDTKVSTAAISVDTNYYPVLGTDTTFATTKYYDSGGLRYVYSIDSESNTGLAELILGNGESSGTTGNKKGLVTFYSNNNKRVFLRATNDLTANIAIALPSSSGTLALTSDLSDYVAKSGDTMTGALTMANGRYFQGKNANGDNRIVCGISSDNTYMFGYGSRNSSEGGSYFDGNAVHIRSNGVVSITAPSGMTITTSTNITHTLPLVIGGTILNSGTTSFTQTLTAGTEIGKIKINGTTQSIYTRPSEKYMIYLGAAQAISSTSLAIIKCTSNFYLIGSGYFSVTSDGGIKCLFHGGVLVSAVARYTGLTANDRVTAQIGVYRSSSWVAGTVRPQYYANGSGSETVISIPNTPIQVQENDTIYLRGANGTSARGSAAAGCYLVVERIA